MINIIGNIGKLNNEIEDEWMVWRIVKEDLSLYACIDKMDFKDLCILNAILDMKYDNEKAVSSYYDEKNKNIK